MASLRLQDIYKVYQSGVVAVTDFTLDIEEGIYECIVGNVFDNADLLSDRQKEKLK